MLCLGRRTITGLLTTSGSQFQDWSASYRLFSQNRLPTPEIFSVIRRAIAEELPAGAPFHAVLDDTLVRRAGLHTPGVAWRRDPLGPRFQTNFVRAQRFVQISGVLPAAGEKDGSPGAFRLAPIAFLHTPTATKPGKKATAAQQKQYRLDAASTRISLRGAQQVIQLRASLDLDPGGLARPLIVAFDGGYTNSTVLKRLPARTTAIGRIRKDAKLHLLPAPAVGKTNGRPRRYGQLAPTPDQLRTDEAHPWESLPLFHSGHSHLLRFKRLPQVMWRPAGVGQLFQLVVIAPLAYRLRKGSRLLYRDPAYLLCTDPALDPRQVIEAYFQRWDIEVNFREEKTLLGAGQAQVRHPVSVEAAPALTVAAYSLLLVSARRAFANSSDGLLPPPKWSAKSPGPRTSTQQMLHQIRAEVWGRGLGLDTFSDFATQIPSHPNPHKPSFPLASAILYANS